MKKHDDTPSESATVSGPEETAVDRFVNRYSAAGKRTIKELLEGAAIIAEAHEELGKRLLGEFYERIRLDPEGSTARKMKNVGKMKPRFEPHTHLLPNNWTTLSYLASRTEDEYRKLIDGNVLHSVVTLETIKSHVSTAKKPSRPKPERLVIDLIKVEDTGRPAFATKLKKLLKEYKVLSEEKQAPTLDKFIAQAETGGVNA